MRAGPGTLRRIALALLVATLSSGYPGPVSADTVAAQVEAADPASGERVFRKCKACHTVSRGGRNLTGPNLWGVVGRPKGSVDGFKYSKGLASLGGVWDVEQLYEYLHSPRKFVKGSRMTFVLRKPRERVAVIAYLQSMHDDSPDSATAGLAEPTAEETALLAADYAGLPPGDGRDEVFALCSACHSLKLVTQQGLNERRWDGLMDWMVEEQGMDEMDEETRGLVVRYLATHFGEDSRRN